MRNRWTQRVAALVLIGIVGSVSWAEGSAGDANDLEMLPDYLRYAALHNSGLQAAFEEWKAQLQQVLQAKALPDPRFTYSYFIQEVETRVGPQRQRVSVTQVFPWFGTIEARTDAAAAAAKAAQKRYEAKKLQLFYDVKDTFCEYVYLQRAIEIARDDLDLVRHFEEVVRNKYVTATAGHPDIIRAQVELATLDDKLKTLEELQTPIVARLNAVLNRPNASTLPWPKQRLASPADVDRAELFAVLRQQNPELQAMDFDIESARSRIELAKKRFYPDLGLGVDWIDTGDAIMPGVADSGKDPVILMFSMNLPIWRKSYGAAELQARAAARRVSHQKQDMENGLIARTERVLYDYEDS
ncbi:MAG: TolC family protein, partial [Sedimentisphaerales bacterium]|nr:TolC family protein [Sedimentisphaerales bacterium]